MKTIRKEDSDFLINTNVDNSYYGKERFGIIGEADAILNKDKLYPDLGVGNVAIFSSMINDEAQIEIAGSNPDAILGTTAIQIGIQSMTFEPETSIADLIYSTNGHLNEGFFTGESGYLVGNEINSGGFLFEKDNAEWGLEDDGHFVLDQSMNELGSLASFNTGVFMDTSLSYADGRIEFLADDTSLGDMSSGVRLTDGASFLGTSGNTFLDIEMDSDYEVGAINQVGVSNIQAENNFNLVDADLGIGIATYQPSGQFNDGIVRKANDFEIVGNSILDEANVFSANGLTNFGSLNFSMNNQWNEFVGTGILNSVNFVDSFEGSSWLSGPNQIQTAAFLENISYIDDVSFLGTSENTLLDVGMDSVHDFETARHEEDLLEKAVHEALEEFGKSYKIKDSEISIESFTKTFQSNSLYSSSHTINMAVVNFIIVEGDVKHNNICLIENNNS